MLLRELAASKDVLGKQAYVDSDATFFRGMAEVALVAMAIALLFGGIVAVSCAAGIARRSTTSSVSSGVASASQQLRLLRRRPTSGAGAQEQAASLEETAASLEEEITATVKQNADSAQHAAQLASASRDVAEKSGRVVDAAVSAMSNHDIFEEEIAGYHHSNRAG